jgi:hypothetical protein
LTRLSAEVELVSFAGGSWWHNLDGGAPVQLQLRGRKLRANAEAVRDPGLVADALTAIVRDHPPYGRWAHVRVRADGTPDAADVRAEVARGRVLVRVQLPPEDTTAR